MGGIRYDWRKALGIRAIRELEQKIPLALVLGGVLLYSAVGEDDVV